MTTTAYDQRFAAAIGGTNRWVTTAEWSNDGGVTWQQATYRTGSVTCAATSQIRWTCNLTLQAPFGLDGINPYQTRIRVRHGLYLSPYEPPLMRGMGVYAVDSVERNTDSADLAVTGSSFEAYLIRSKFTKARTFRKQRAYALLDQLIHEVLPNAQIDFDASLDAETVLPTFTVENDRWSTIDGSADATSIAKSLAARVYPDGDGVWRVLPVPTFQDDPAWEATQGPGGVLLKQTENLSSDGVTNVVIVTGTPSGGAIIGPAIAKDLDPNSLTFVGRSPDAGGFGEAVADTYSSQLIVSTKQANAVAQARLAVKLGLAQKLTFDSLHDPSKAPGQVGILHGFQPQRAILDSVTYDLSPAPGPLQCDTRTTATRLAGAVVDPTPVLDDADGNPNN